MKKALIIQAARFGDILQTRRLALSLARKYELHMAVDKALARLASLVYPEAIIHPLVFHGSPSPEAMKENIAAFGRLRETGFESVIECNFSRLAVAPLRLFAPKKAHGYRFGRDSLGGILRSRWARAGFRASANRAATPLNLVDFWGYFTDEPVAPGQVNPAARPGGGGMGVAVAGREERRSLPVPVLAAIVDQAFKLRAPKRIVFLGTEAESRRARMVIRRLSPAASEKAVDLCGKTDWDALIGEVRGLDFLLAPDTGLLHLAAFLGVPAIAFFLSSAWCHETGPYGEGHIIFQSGQPCSPCLESSACQKDLACHKPFADPAFLRTFAQALAGKQEIATTKCISVWKSGFDDLGAKLELVAGSDQMARTRALTRAILKQELGLAGAPLANELENPDYIQLLSHFLPESEWMLPPWRYC